MANVFLRERLAFKEYFVQSWGVYYFRKCYFPPLELRFSSKWLRQCLNNLSNKHLLNIWKMHRQKLIVSVLRVLRMFTKLKQTFWCIISFHSINVTWVSSLLCLLLFNIILGNISCHHRMAASILWVRKTGVPWVNHRHLLSINGFNISRSCHFVTYRSTFFENKCQLNLYDTLTFRVTKLCAVL